MPNKPAFLKWMDDQPKAAIALFAGALAILLGYIDYITGFEAAFSAFYLIPVAFAAYGLGEAGGIFFSISCAFIWIFSNTLAGEVHPTWITVWNGFMFAILLLIITGLVAETNRMLEIRTNATRVDTLTGIWNENAFRDAVEMEMTRSRRYRHSMTVARVDFSGLHLENGGTDEEILQMTVNVIRNSIRHADMLARLDVNQFALLLPETNEQQADIAASRLRNIIADEISRYERDLSFNMGFATYATPPASIAQLMHDMEDAVNNAQKNGNNTVEFIVA